jgi:MFS family permease
MSVVTRDAPPSRPRVQAPARRLWIPAAGVLLGAGWGSNQFTPMLLVYHQRLGLSTPTLEALFGVYALGLIPGLLAAGRWSDTHGRRPVAIGAAALSLAASICLLGGAYLPAFLFAGRLLVGISSGAAFSAGTAWLREASLPPFGDASPQAAGRRAALAMTAGFALGPLSSGLIAQWAPAPAVLAYLPHIALMLAVLSAVRCPPETRQPAPRGAARLTGSGITAPRFRGLVAPMAPWVFCGPVIAFALLPSITGTGRAAEGIAITAGVAVLTAIAGVLIQPVARRLETSGLTVHVGVIGLLVLTAGLGLAALTAQARQTWLLIPCALVFGAAYGLCLIAGLLEVQQLAHPSALGALTAAYYALTYLGFAVPYLLALASGLAAYPVLLLVTAALALATAAQVQRASRARGRGGS